MNTETAMVSIRRRKLLGLCSGLNSSVAPISKYEQGQHTENRVDNTKPVSVHPMVLDDIDPLKERTSVEIGPGSSNVPTSSPLKEHHIHQFPELKRRKRHRRKHVENQEQCIMRGVYFKNMKWQAAIKVDKKQIHLGTVGSQEEAAKLYDRAAFMCGREPNFELSENEKQQLGKFNWDEFLAITRSAITSKKNQRRTGPVYQRKLETNGWGGEQGLNGFSASVDNPLVP
ncbi:ethylene-responsive transcription factor-like protein At4g13040 isoform X3 [Olea europaea var. sylvestris]|uniref:ethylene-responsive transcription factor-like protein At4g13040 isoform X3 n=1 Tax=Olea europaea var. sylvestris TaxID=158386 RepID=UPI000C1D2886|nr:ethylene-responsive transcription factor-like protein At4g13040 isoform X3 [Olea europaea var. sylvestris]